MLCVLLTYDVVDNCYVQERKLIKGCVGQNDMFSALIFRFPYLESIYFLLAQRAGTFMTNELFSVVLTINVVSYNKLSMLYISNQLKRTLAVKLRLH